MIGKIDDIANLLLSKFGYEICRKTPELSTRDPFKQQQLIFRDHAPLIIFDVGAHTGYVTKKYRRLFPTANIHAFEPFDQSYKELVDSVAQDKNIVANQLAITDHTGPVTLYINSSSATNSLLQVDERGADYWDPNLIETHTHALVNATTIDSYCHEHGIKHIDILKLDIQGTELVALNGAKTLLEKRAITLIYTEMIIAPTYKNQSPFYELIDFLKGYGLRLFNIYDLHYKQNQLIQLDGIFMLS